MTVMLMGLRQRGDVADSESQSRRMYQDYGDRAKPKFRLSTSDISAIVGVAGIFVILCEQPLSATGLRGIK